MTNPLRTILCVDDDADVLHIARLCLETVGGFTVTAVQSGTEAIQEATVHVPDLILLDVMMPGQDGPSTLTALRAIPQLAEVPVIFITARIRDSETKEYLALGANGVIAKPFDPMALSDQVRAIWDQFQPDANAFELQMQALRLQYRQQLTERLSRLEALLAAPVWNEAARGELRTQAHQLAGTGKTYGFSAISDAGYLLEDALTAHPHEDAAFFKSPLQALIAQCRSQAITSTTIDASDVVLLSSSLILLVDDDPLLPRTLGKLLQKETRIAIAASTEAARHCLAREVPALVLLDRWLEGDEDGLALLAEMQAHPHWRTIPVVMLSGDRTAEFQERARALGARACLTKPLALPEALDEIRAFLAAAA